MEIEYKPLMKSIHYQLNEMLIDHDIDTVHNLGHTAMCAYNLHTKKLIDDETMDRIIVEIHDSLMTHLEEFNSGEDNDMEQVSDCCGAPQRSDIEICSDCKEHCEFVDEEV